MSKINTQHRDLMREQLAHQTARLMAEDGITDFGFAKRKAAKQLGAAETQHLPSNQEVEAALHSYRALYQRDSHPAILHQLRSEALDAMRLLDEFSPYLTGSVLSGTAGELSDINIMCSATMQKRYCCFCSNIIWISRMGSGEYASAGTKKPYLATH